MGYVDLDPEEVATRTANSHDTCSETHIAKCRTISASVRSRDRRMRRRRSDYICCLLCDLAHPSPFLLEQRSQRLGNMDLVTVAIPWTYECETDWHVVLTFEANHVHRGDVEDGPHRAERLVFPVSKLIV